MCLLIAGPAAAHTPLTHQHIFFAEGSSLDGRAEALLDNFLTAYHTWPAVIFVEGGADLSGPAPYNRELSCRRALAVADYLEQRGVPNDKMIVLGYGAVEPLVNDAPVDRKSFRMRRVVVRFPETGNVKSSEWRGETGIIC